MWAHVKNRAVAPARVCIDHCAGGVLVRGPFVPYLSPYATDSSKLYLAIAYIGFHPSTFPTSYRHGKHALRAFWVRNVTPNRKNVCWYIYLTMLA